MTNSQSPNTVVDEFGRPVNNSEYFSRGRDPKATSVLSSPWTSTGTGTDTAPNKTLLYKRGHFISSVNSFCIVEIAATAENELLISAQDLQSGISLTTKQGTDAARKTLLLYNNDLQAIAEAV